MEVGKNVKKSLTIAVIAVLAVGLIAGSLYVVLRPEEVHAEGARGARWNAAVADTDVRAGWRDAGGECGHGRGEAVCDEDCDRERDEEQACETRMGSGRGASELPAHPVSVRQDRGRRGIGYGSERAWRAQEDMEWVTVEGQVIAVDEGAFTLLTADGREIEVHTGPEWYWDESGYKVNVGDDLRVTGCDHDDEFAVGQIENLTTGDVITLCDEEGHPAWAGRGRRGQS
jgi:hypothetical protein